MATPSGQSLVTVREYDSQSRLAREWQPVVSPNTDFTDPSEVSALANAPTVTPTHIRVRNTPSRR